MGGTETFSGTSFQVGVATYLACHIVGQRRVPFDDVPREVPVGIGFEKKGAGDDIRLETSGTLTYEIQVKHGARADKRLVETIEGFAKLQENEWGVLVVDSDTSTKSVSVTLRKIFQAWRDGNEPNIPRSLRDKLAPLDGTDPGLRRRLAVIPISLAIANDGQQAIEMLRNILEIEELAETAIAVLHEEIHNAHSRRGYMNRARLIQILEEKEIRLRDRQGSQLAAFGVKSRGGLPSRADLTLDRDPRLDTVNRLLQERRPQSVLDAVEAIWVDGADDAELSARLLTAKGAALIEMGDVPSALDSLRSSLAILPDHVPTLLNLANASAQQGDLDRAARYAQRATELAPTRADGWAMRIDVEDLATSQVPIEVRSEPPIRIAAAVRELRAGETEQGISILEEVANDSLGARVLLADALLARGEAGSESVQRASTLAESVAIAVPNLDSELGRRALYASAIACELNGDIRQAQASLVRLADAPILSQQMAAAAAAALVDTKQPQKALDVTQRFDSPGAAILSVMSRAQNATNDSALAASTLRRAIPACATDEDVIAVALAALELDLHEEAQRVLSQAKSENFLLSVLRARTADASGDSALADAEYQQAMRLSGGSAGIRLEYASFLRGNQRFDDAYRTVEPSMDADARSQQMGAELSVDRGDLARACELAERSLPNLWARRLLARVALHRGDISVAIHHLEAWLESEDLTLPRLWLAECYWKLGDRSKCEATLQGIDPEVCSTVELIALARVTDRIGEADTALEFAFQALRRDLNSDGVLLDFFRIAVTRNDVEPPSIVAPDTGCILIFDNDERREYLIVDDSKTPLAAFEEVSAKDTVIQKLLGQGVGTRVRVPSIGGERTVEVAEIVDRYTHALRWVAREIPKRDLAQTHFAAISTRGEQGEFDFSKIDEILKDASKRHDEIVRVYEERCLPLGFVAQAISRPTSQAYSLVSLESAAGMFVESPSAGSEAYAVPRSGTVVTHSAVTTLQTVDDLEVLELLDAPLYSTPGLCDALEMEVEALRHGLKSGSKHVGWRKDHREVVELTGEQVASRADAHSKALEWIRANTTLIPRPANWETEYGRLSEVIGQESVDACLAATETGAIIYADDLGLRLLAASEFSAKGFSTHRLIQGKRLEGELEAERYSEIEVKLLVLKHVAIPLRVDALVSVLTRTHFEITDEVERVAWHLGRPWVELGSACRVVALALREVALHEVHSSRLRGVAYCLFAALLQGRERARVRDAMGRAIATAFTYIPLHANEVTRLLEDFLVIRD